MEKTAMTPLVEFATNLISGFGITRDLHPMTGSGTLFEALSLELFSLQYEAVPPYQAFCRSRGATPQSVRTAAQIPAVPARSFKEIIWSGLPESERTQVFHSSGTTEQRPSRHYHSEFSLRLYEQALLSWFCPHLLPDPAQRPTFLSLTPPSAQAPHSSLVHMFDTLHQTLGSAESRFIGSTDPTGGWRLNETDAIDALENASRGHCPVIVLGTAFSYVHLLDAMTPANQRVRLPDGSRLLETGGYKGRSREIPRLALYQTLSQYLGIPTDSMVAEYGMSELSSQAYDRQVGEMTEPGDRLFRFPPWTRVSLICPETGEPVVKGQTGLIRIHDLANVFSIACIQTEDLGILGESGFELLGRPPKAEPRGCSLLAVPQLPH